MPLTISSPFSSLSICCLSAISLSVFANYLTVSLPAQVFYEWRQYLLSLLLPHVAVSALVAALDENFVDFAALVGIGFACQNLLELSLFLLHENCFPLGCAFFSDRSPPPSRLFRAHANATRCYSLCTFNWDLLCTPSAMLSRLMIVVVVQIVVDSLVSPVSKSTWGTWREEG